MPYQTINLPTADISAPAPKAQRFAARVPEAPGDGFRPDRMPSRRLSISENLFNKLVLQPSNIARTKPDKDLGNPTPMYAPTSHDY